MMVVRQISRNTSSFSDTGSVPPKADEKTTYTITLKVSAGNNDVTGAVITSTIPSYATWENKSDGDGTVLFNSVNKEVSWTIGGMNANATKEVSFQVGITPSQNQVGTIPAVLGTQSLRATDSFTKSVVRAEGLPLSAQLSPEAGFPEDSGVVVR